jgi:3-hydroxybutyryl-CoA dehydratase
MADLEAEMTDKKSLEVRKGFFFEDYEIGQTITSPGRTVTEADVSAFAGLTGDWSSIHTDAVYAAKHPVGQRIAHGMLGVAIASGLAVRLGFLEDTLLFFREIEHWKFSQPVFLGDTLCVRITVSDCKAVPRLGGGLVGLQAEVLNQAGQVVQSGKWTVLVKSRAVQAG